MRKAPLSVARMTRPQPGLVISVLRLRHLYLNFQTACWLTYFYLSDC